MTREEMIEKLFSNAQADKLPPQEKELMSEDEQKIFNTGYEEGYDDGYSDGLDDREKTLMFETYNKAMLFALESFADSLRYSMSFYHDKPIPKAAILDIIDYTQENLSKFF